MKVHLEVSEAQREPNDLTGLPPIRLDQPTNVTIDTDDFVQVTYGYLRIGPHGEHVASLDADTEFWRLRAGTKLERVTTWEGEDLDLDTNDEDWLFTDFVIAEN
jgi:hypothetical protein